MVCSCHWLDPRLSQEPCSVNELRDIDTAFGMMMMAVFYRGVYVSSFRGCWLKEWHGLMSLLQNCR